jgi:hypothetical protein
MGLDIHSFIELSKNNEQTWKLDKRSPFESEHLCTPDNPLPGQIALGRFPEMFWLMTGKMGTTYLGHSKLFNLNGIERGILASKGLSQLPVPLRGLPNDACEEIKAYWKWVGSLYPGCTSEEAYPSWLSYTELRLICEVYKEKRMGGLWGFLAVLKRMKKIEEDGGRARFVFWFSY